MVKLENQQILVLVCYAVIMGMSQLVMVNASKEIGGSIEAKGVLLSILQSGWLWMALTIYGFATILWLFILFRVDIRIAYPIATTSVIFTAIFQSIKTGEYPRFSYWIGVIFVLIGLSIINIKS